MTDLIPCAAVEAAVLRALDNSDPEACEWVLKAIRSIPPAQEGWQPIETAPVDEDVFVCWTHAPDEYEVAVQWEDGTWWQHDHEYKLTTPTHWQRPSAPRAILNKGE